MFGHKQLNSKEYEELIKRVTTLEARLNSIEIENETLRNKVLRKIQAKRAEIEEETPVNQLPKSKPLNSFSPFG